MGIVVIIVGVVYATIYAWFTVYVDILDSHSFRSPYAPSWKIISGGHIQFVQHRYFKKLRYYRFVRKTPCRKTNQLELKKFKERIDNENTINRF